MIVLDASALLAYVFGDPGADTVEAALADAAIDTVNFMEFLVELARRGSTPSASLDVLHQAGVMRLLRLEPITPEDALVAAGFVGPSLTVGERACLALAKRLRATVLTVDPLWAASLEDLEVAVKSIVHDDLLKTV